MPIMDGSAEIIVHALLKAGQKQLKQPASYLQILKEVNVKGENGAWAKISPSNSLDICLNIDFPDPGIGSQRLEYSFSTSSYINTISPARTFCMLRDVQNMKHAGLAKGGSLENAIVVDNGKVLNRGGLRMQDECVRHKVLDCLGDLYLLGMQVKGKLTSFRPGHALSTKLVQALWSDPMAYQITEDGLPMANSDGYALPEVAAAAAV